MRLAEPIHSYLKDRLSQKSVVDGRIWVTAVLALYFASIYLVSLFLPYEKVWQRTGVPAMTPIFADLRAVLGGFECTRQGYDVLHVMPCDPYGRGSLAYPRLWMKLEWLGLDLSHSIVIGIAFAVIFYAVTLRIIGRLNKYEAVIYTLLLCSPPVILLVERANVDILMYALLFLCLTLAGSRSPLVRFIGYSMILLPSALKLLPIFSLGVILKERRRAWALFCIALLAALFMIYCYAIREELRVFKGVYVYLSWYSFGARILPHETLGIVKALLSGAPITEGMRLPLAAIVLLFSAMSVSILLAGGKAFRRWIEAPLSPAKDVEPGSTADFRLDAFRIGTCLYLGTFLFTIAFDYKLSFLVLAMPQMIFWIKHDAVLGRASGLALVGILATLYISPFFERWLIDECINWLLFLYFAGMLLVTLPDWIKIPIHKLFYAARREVPA